MSMFSSLSFSLPSSLKLNKILKKKKKKTRNKANARLKSQRIYHCTVFLKRPEYTAHTEKCSALTGEKKQESPRVRPLVIPPTHPPVPAVTCHGAPVFHSRFTWEKKQWPDRGNTCTSECFYLNLLCFENQETKVRARVHRTFFSLLKLGHEHFGLERRMGLHQVLSSS